MVAAFLLPLLGMHRRLAGEKARLQGEVNQEMETVYRELQKQVRSKAYAHVDELDKALSGVLRMREVVAKLSTWPWQPETLRGLLAAVGLPIVIWLIQYRAAEVSGMRQWSVVSGQWSDVRASALSMISPGDRCP